MEILYVIAGGGLVALGFFMANMGKKPKAKPEPRPEYTPEPAPEEVPKSGIPINEQVDTILGYNPYKALQNGDKK